MITSDQAKQMAKRLKADPHQGEIWADVFLIHYERMASTPMGRVSEPEFGLLLSMNQYLIECMKFYEERKPMTLQEAIKQIQLALLSHPHSDLIATSFDFDATTFSAGVYEYSDSEPKPLYGDGYGDSINSKESLEDALIALGEEIQEKNQ